MILCIHKQALAGRLLTGLATKEWPDLILNMNEQVLAILIAVD